MRRRTTWLAASAAAAALSPWLPGLLTAAGLDAWNAPDLHRKLADGTRESERLSREIDHVREQLLMKERLSDDLTAGRLTLAEATDHFEAMVATHPRVAAGLRALYPDATTDRERAARHVVDYTRNRTDDPAERARLSGRMAAEFDALFPALRPADTDPTRATG